MKAILTDDEQRFAESVIRDLDADELEIVRDIARQPKRRWGRGRSDSVGFGADAAVEFIGPYVVLVTVWVQSIAFGEAKAVAEKRIRQLTRRLLGVPPPPLPRVSTREDDDLRNKIIDYAKSLGLSRKKAETLASAVMSHLDSDS